MLRHLFACIVILAGFIPLTASAQEIGTIEMKGSHLKVSSPILVFNMTMGLPSDVSTGMASGKRQHSPIMIMKVVDGSSPALFQAASTGEVLQTVTIAVGKSGRKETSMTIKLTNAVISRVNLMAGTGNTGVSAGDPLEELSFTYQKISISWSDSKTTFNDDWLQ